MTAFADSENTIICHSELDSESRSKTRCTLKNEDPLIAVSENRDRPAHMVCHIFRERPRSWPEPRQDDVKQEITVIPQCSYTGFLVLSGGRRTVNGGPRAACRS